MRDKGLHISDFVNAEMLHGKFDVNKVKRLNYPDSLNYRSNKDNLPDEIVYKAWDKILEFMTAYNIQLILGFLGYRKLKGTVIGNLRLKKVGFLDNNTNTFRTAMTMKDESRLQFAKIGFHLFPNASKLL